MDRGTFGMKRKSFIIGQSFGVEPFSRVALSKELCILCIITTVYHNLALDGNGLSKVFILIGSSNSKVMHRR